MFGAKPDREPAAVTVATWTILPFGGHREQPGEGIPLITGGVWSILTVTDEEADNLAALVAEHVRVIPGVSAVRLVGPQPEEVVMTESGSLTFQLTVTALRYHPLLPVTPEISGTISGGLEDDSVQANTALLYPI